MTSIVEQFGDPLDPPRSLQLNNRYWPDETFTHLEVLREADDDINRRRIGALRKSLKGVLALLPPRYHRALVRRVVYSMLYHVQFDPIRFSVRLSDDFVRANKYEGPDNEVCQPAKQAEELRHIVGLAQRAYQDCYGSDFVFSHFEVRYMNSTNARVTDFHTYGGLSDFHLDQLMSFTCIIYLCEAKRANGCFSFIDASSRIPKSHLLRALHQVVTFDMWLQTPAETSHLPLELRGSMTYGNYLDEEKVERLSGARVDFEGGVGDGIMFNGFDTLHRGGKPTTGERSAVFIATGGHFRMRAKKYAGQMLASLWL